MEEDMAHKEYGMTDIIDILRRAKAKDGIRCIVRATGIARNTVRNYLRLAAEHGFTHEVSNDSLPDIAGAVFRSIHDSGRNDPATGASAPLVAHRGLIADWLDKDALSVTKVQIKLQRMGVAIGYSTLYRYACEELGFGGHKVTVRMAETAPGEVAQVDFGKLGLVYDPETKRNRVLHALLVTLISSRHQYVYTTHRQDINALITGIEEAWEFFGGVTRRVIIDNMKAAVIKSDRYEPVFNRTFLEYSEHRGFIIDPAVVRHPEGKATVENQIKYVQENFFKGETFIDRDHAQREAEKWCRTTAGLRIHGTTRKRPLLVFEQEEQQALLPLAGFCFDVPVWAVCKVHRDHHIRFKNSLYSLPTIYVGKEVEVKGTKSLVRIYYQTQLVKTHQKAVPGKRATDFDDYPKEKSAYAMRDVEYYKRTAATAGQKQGEFMTELLTGDVPWIYIRQAQQLLRLNDKYGKERVETACGRALAFGLMNVSRVERIIKQSLDVQPHKSTTGGCNIITLPAARFQRDANYFAHKETNHGTIV